MAELLRMKSARYLGWKAEPPKQKDWKFSESPWANAPIKQQSTKRRENGLLAPIMDQGPIGSCVGCSSAYGVAYLTHVDKDAKHSSVFSALYQYYMARTFTDPSYATVDSGAFIRDSMDSLRVNGIPLESQYKYNAKKWAAKPSATVQKEAKRWKLGAHYTLDNIEDMMRALDAGCAVVGGVELFASMDTDEVTRTGDIPMPQGRRDKDIGGHALHWYDYDYSRRVFKLQNSWKVTPTQPWGDEGFGTVPFEYLANKDLADDFWAMAAEAPETTPWKD